VLALAALVLVGPPALARADDPPERAVRFAEEGDRLVASFDVPGLIDGAVRRRLRSGIPVQVVVRAWVVSERTGETVGAGAQTCRVAFDLWDEVFRVTVGRAGSELRLVLDSESQVVRTCTSLHDLPIARSAELEVGHAHRLAVLAEVDPIDRRTLGSIRRWLAHPGGQSAAERGGLFGSFASVFVNRRIGASERTVRFRSQRFRLAAGGRAP
jgi:hypothetical protein